MDLSLTSSYLLYFGYRIIADIYINTGCYSLSYIYWNLSKTSLFFFYNSNAGKTFS